MVFVEKAFKNNSGMPLDGQCYTWRLDSLFNFILTSRVANVFLALSIAYYIYHKCPYIVRINGVICAVAWFVKLLDLECERTYDNKTEPDAFTFIISLLCGCERVLRSNFLTIHTIFITSCFVRLWWCEKLNIIKDETCVDLEYIKESTKLKGIAKRKMIKKYLQMRNVGKALPNYPNGWLPILESRDLKTGQAKSVFALGQTLAVFRGYDGKAHVLDAYCPHLGANLAIGGKVVGNCIECPFHSWQLDGESGICTNIPYSAGKIPAVGKTKSWLCKEVNAFIYVWHHAENLPPSWHMPSVPEIEDESVSYKGRTEHTIRCRLQATFENAADIAHFDILHSKPTFNWSAIKHEWKNPTWKPYDDADKWFMSKLALTAYTTVFKFTLPLTTVLSQTKLIGSSTIHVQQNTVLGKYIMLINFVTEKPFQQRAIQQIYCSNLFPQWLANEVLKHHAIQLERDILIWNNMKILKDPALVKEDKLIHSFRRWLSQFYTMPTTTETDTDVKCIDW